MRKAYCATTIEIAFLLTWIITLLLTCLAGYIRSWATRAKNDLSIHSSFLIIWSKNKGLGSLQQYRVIIDANMHCWCSNISGSLLGSLLGDANSAPELLGWTGFLGFSQMATWCLAPQLKQLAFDWQPRVICPTFKQTKHLPLHLGIVILVGSVMVLQVMNLWFFLQNIHCRVHSSLPA